MENLRKHQGTKQNSCSFTREHVLQEYYAGQMEWMTLPRWMVIISNYNTGVLTVHKMISTLLIHLKTDSPVCALPTLPDFTQGRGIRRKKQLNRTQLSVNWITADACFDMKNINVYVLLCCRGACYHVKCFILWNGRFFKKYAEKNIFYKSEMLLMSDIMN